MILSKGSLNSFCASNVRKINFLLVRLNSPVSKEQISENVVSVLLKELKYFFPLDLTYRKELERLNKEREKLESEIDRVEKASLIKIRCKSTTG